VSNALGWALLVLATLLCLCGVVMGLVYLAGKAVA